MVSVTPIASPYRGAHWFARIYDVDDSPSRIVPMEGLRGLAVLLVFFVHYAAVFDGEASGASLGWTAGRFLGVVGNTGVDLFFVISGFLIYGAFVRRPPVLRSFLWRRIVRIYPTFTAVFLVYVVLSLLSPEHSKLPAGGFARGVFLLQNFLLLPGIGIGQPLIAVAWSLTFEFLFYLTLPALILLIGLGGWSAAARARAILSVSLMLLVVSRLMFDSGYARLAMFGAGMLVYEWLAVCRPRPRGWRHAAVACLFGAALALYWAADAIPGWPSFVSMLGLFLGFAIFTRYAISDGPIATALSWAPARYLGNMSYSYYLIHGLTLLTLGAVAKKLVDMAADPARFWMLMPVAFAITLLPATCLFVCIEKPFSLKKRKAHAVAPGPSNAVTGAHRPLPSSAAGAVLLGLAACIASFGSAAFADSLGPGDINNPATGPAPSVADAGAGWVLVKNWDFGTSGTIAGNDDLAREFLFRDQFNTTNLGGLYGAKAVAATAASGLPGQTVDNPSRPFRDFTPAAMRTYLRPIDPNAQTVSVSRHEVGSGFFMPKFSLPRGGALLGKDILWETRVRLNNPVQAYWFAIWAAGDKWNRGAEMDVVESFGFDNGNGYTNFDAHLFHANSVGGTDDVKAAHWEDQVPGRRTDLTQWHTWTWLYRKDDSYTVWFDNKPVQTGKIHWTVGGKPDGVPINMRFLFDPGWGHAQVQSVNVSNFPAASFKNTYYEWDYSRVYLRP